MSEESLLAEAETSIPGEETTETTTETTETPAWAYAEGITGEGDAPEWFKGDKFKSVSAQAEAYKNLESKFGGFTGAPEEYEATMPDGIEGEFITDDPLYQDFQSWAKDNQLNQDAFTNILHMFVKNEHANLGQNRESELTALGADAKSRLQNISDYAKANLSEDEYDGILEATTTAAGVKAVEALIAKTRGYKIPGGHEDISTGLTHTELREKMNDPRYGSDPDFRKEVDKLYEQKFGKEPKRTTVG